MTSFYEHGSRIIDIILAIAATLILFPLILATAILILVTMGRPVIFKQLRPGINKQIFNIYKFRTMASTKIPNSQVLPDNLRLTKIGRIIRSLSLDELPELWNVLVGEMSLVGPRPLLLEYLSLYTPQQARRHLVRPGITGWAQINGRNALSWEQKFEYDIWYVENRSIYLNLKILGITAFQVIKRNNINRPGHETMPRFLGSGGTDG